MDTKRIVADSILAAVGDAIVATDREGIIQTWNGGAERMFGFPAEEAIGQSLDLIIPQQLRARHWEGFSRVMETGASRYGEGDLLAVPGLRKDGQRISVEFTIVPLKDGTGKITGLAAVIRAVTVRFNEIKALKQKLAQASRSGQGQGDQLMSAEDMAQPFFTVGHSTRSISEFVELLRASQIRCVVDVRTVPRSRTNPQFNRDTLPDTLAAHQIDYEHIAELGGLRGTAALGRAIPERILGERELPQLCRPCPHARISRRLGSPARARDRAARGHHVRGGGVVALPPPHHHGLSAGRRRNGVPYPRPRQRSMRPG
jgi:PAS domain S-box-containing protein